MFYYLFTDTTGIRAFAECRTLCRVPFLGHSAKMALPRAALGKVRLSVTSLFTECRTLVTGPHSAKTCLPSVKHSAKGALGKGPSAAVPKLTAVSLCRDGRFSLPSAVWHSANIFAECPRKSSRQRRLCRCTVHRAFFAECNTRQSICRVFLKALPSASGTRQSD
jgi:hypothetical protein